MDEKQGPPRWLVQAIGLCLDITSSLYKEGDHVGEDIGQATERLDQAVARQGKAIDEARQVIEDIHSSEMVRYKGFLQDAMLALVNLHGLAVEMREQGKTVADAEFGEIGHTFIQHLNIRRKNMLTLVSDRLTSDLEVQKSEQSVRTLVEQLREFGIYWPELWP